MMSILVLLAACVYGYGGMWGMTLEEERKALEEQRRTLERERREFTRRVEIEDRRMEQQQKLFNMKFKILEEHFSSDNRLLCCHGKIAYPLIESFLLLHMFFLCCKFHQFFSGVESRQSLKKRYKDLNKIYHPDNLDGDKNTVQEINSEYHKLCAVYKN